MVVMVKPRKEKEKVKGGEVSPQAIVKGTNEMEMAKAKRLANTSSREMATASEETTVVTVMTRESKGAREKGHLH